MNRDLNAPKKFNDNDRRSLEEIVDNVYIINHYKERKLIFKDALALIREVHDPTMYGKHDSLIEAKVELDLRTKKKTKFVEHLNGIISYSHSFPYSARRKIIAVCKTEEDQEAAKAAGADLVGSNEIIHMLKVGEINVNNFDDLVCHGDMLIELATIKKNIGFYFPTSQRGNIGFDMSRLVNHFVTGIEFKMNKDGIEPDYGFIKLPFGRLTLLDNELEENFQRVLNTIDANRPQGAPGI